MNRFKLLSALCAASLALALLAGCAGTVDDTADGEDREDAWEQLWPGLEDAEYNAKTHYWQVLDSEDQELYRIDGEASVAALDDLFQEDSSWKQLESEPETPLYTYVFWQEKTLLAGQDPETERDYEELIRVTIYEDADVIAFQVLPNAPDTLSGVDISQFLTFFLSVPAETAEILRNPAQLAEPEGASR